MHFRKESTIRGLILAASVLASWLSIPSLANAATAEAFVEQWDAIDRRFDGPTGGNPFVDVQLTATFKHVDENVAVKVTGFYDGNGKYIIRFMPDKVGRWGYTTHSNVAALNGQTG